MATTYATEAAYLDPAGAVRSGDAQRTNGRIIPVVATITLAAQANGDIVVLGKTPVGGRFIGGRITASATLGSATVKIGPASSDAAYRAAATFTTANVPTTFGPAAALAGATVTADEEIHLTVGAAALPASGVLSVICFFQGI